MSSVEFGHYIARDLIDDVETGWLGQEVRRQDDQHQAQFFELLDAVDDLCNRSMQRSRIVVADVAAGLDRQCDGGGITAFLFCNLVQTLDARRKVLDCRFHAPRARTSARQTVPAVSITGDPPKRAVAVAAEPDWRMRLLQRFRITRHV